MVIWQDPPPQRGTRPGRLAWLDELRSRPGEWALVEQDVFGSQVSLWRKRYPDFELTMRDVDEKGRGVLYARYVPDASPQRGMGERLGYALYGEVLFEDGLVVCGECGKTFKILAPHLSRHGMTTETYRVKYGLPRGTALVAESVLHRMTGKTRH